MDRWLPVIVGAVLAVLMVWPWPIQPLNVVGSSVMEADNHLWMLWRSTRWDGVMANWPVGDPRPLQDVVHWPVAALVMPVDPALGYGVALLLDVVVALAGGYWLSREAGASRGGALVGMAVVGTAPVVAGAIVFGLSEAWPIGWYAVHGAAVLRLTRTGDRRWAVVAGGALAAFALSGWYNAFFAAVGEPVWLAWAWWRHRPDRRVWAALVLQGVAAVAVVAPALVWFLAHGDGVGLAAREIPAWEARPDWRHGGIGGTDPLNLVLPTLARTELTRTAYLGLVAVFLGVVGAARRPEARWAWVGVVGLGVLAVGHYGTIAGWPLLGSAPVPMPAAWLTALVPPLAGLTHWYRAAGVAIVFLAPAAALGVSVLVGERSAVWALPLVMLVAADAVFLSDAPWPRPTYDPDPPAALTALPGTGPVLLLPFDAGERRWPKRVPRAYQRWQPWLGRPMSENYEGPDALRANPVVAWADLVCQGGRARPDRFDPEAVTPSAPTGAAAAAAVAELRGSGLEVVVVVRPRSPTPRRCLTALSGYLGEPDGEGDVVAWWRLR